MRLRLSFDRLRGKDLVFRPFLGDDHVVEIDRLRCGWILHSGRPGSSTEWWWTMTGPCCSHAQIDNVGSAATFERAKTQFRAAFERWAAWADAQAGSVDWWGSPEANVGSAEAAQRDDPWR